MLRAAAVVRKPAVKAERVVDAVVLDHDGRHRRRLALKGEKGTEFLLDLEKAAVLNDGDALKLEDGSLVLVKAAPQSLVEIRAATPKRLMRIAWHIGNRHTPAEIGQDAVWIEDDHVLVEMVRGLGGEIARVQRPFQPERGAYEAADAHGHAHHDHSHEHGHAHAHAEAHAHGHQHGDACGCGHDHHHDHRAHDNHQAHDHPAHGHAHKHG